MKIIKNGKDVAKINWHKRLECHSCHSILEVEAEDIYYYYDDVVDKDFGDHEIFSWYYFNCPVCNFISKVEGKEIPQKVKVYAERKFEKK